MKNKMKEESSKENNFSVVDFSGRENIFLNGAILGYDEEFLKEITTIYREDNIGMRQDKEAIEVVENIHTARTEGGYGMNVFSKDLKKKLGE